MSVSTMKLADVLSLADQKFKEGSRAEAIKLYANVLIHFPGNAHAMNCLSAIHLSSIGPASQIYAHREKAISRGPLFEDFEPYSGSVESSVKAFAYYLPQFHRIPENDAAWGDGFTEWRNVARGMPRFEGHLQPRLPLDQGFYDLTAGDVLRQQISLAKAAGLFGFIYYHYWFDRKALLQKPVEMLLKDETLDFPFALMWANESWTRAWDGSEDQVIVKQTYDLKFDIKFVDNLAKHFQDKRYIKISGRPLFFIYRVAHIPQVNRRLEVWRELLFKRHCLDPLIFMAQSFGDEDPRPYGLDGAIEFPPHKLFKSLKKNRKSVKLLDPGFSGQVYAYEDAVSHMSEEVPPDYPLIKTSFPSWDNEARKGERAVVFSGSTPSVFGEWLKKTIQFSKNNPVFGERIIAVNAWNEWAEGAVLEADTHYGYAYLNALSKTLFELPARSQAVEK